MYEGHAVCGSQEHVSEAERVPGSGRAVLGDASAALHVVSPTTPEQRPAASADPGPQQTLRQSPQRGEPGSLWTTGDLYGWIR